jgi:hypothetical protein
MCTVFLNQFLVLNAYFLLIADIQLWLTEPVNSIGLLCIGSHFILLFYTRTLSEVFKKKLCIVMRYHGDKKELPNFRIIGS